MGTRCYRGPKLRGDVLAIQGTRPRRYGRISPGLEFCLLLVITGPRGQGLVRTAVSGFSRGKCTITRVMCTDFTLENIHFSTVCTDFSPVLIFRAYKGCWNTHLEKVTVKLERGSLRIDTF